MFNKYETFMDSVRNNWFLIVFIGGIIYWVGQQSMSIEGIAKANERISTLESRANVMESGIVKMETKIDSIKEDVGLIKVAVIK